MTIPDVAVLPGTDPSVLKNQKDPSGFETLQIGKTRVKEVCDFVQREYAQLLAQAPADIVSASPRTVPLYCTRPPGEQWKFLGRAITPDPGVMVRRKGTTTEIGGSKFNPMQGMMLYTNTPDHVEVDQSVTRHELLHILLQRATHPWSTGPTESLVMGLENHVTPLSSYDDMTRKYPWDMSLTQSTTGLRAPLLTHTIQSPASLGALYLAARHAFHAATREQLWQLANILTQNGLNSGYYPFDGDVEDAVRNVLQEKSRTVLSNPCFQDMRQGGTHVSAYFSRQPGGRSPYAAIYTYAVQRRSDFGLSGDGTYHSVLFECADAQNSCACALHDRQQQPIIDLQFPIAPMQDMKIEDLKRLAAENMPPHLRQHAQRIKAAEIRVGGLRQPFFLEE